MTGEPNPLGVPAPDSPEMERLVKTLRSVSGTRSTESIDKQTWSDAQAVAKLWPGRWGVGIMHDKLRPADMLMLRFLACGSDTGRVSELSDWAQQHDMKGIGTFARIGVGATPFWVPGQVAAGLARTDIPQDRADTVRLPNNAVAVWFQEPLTYDGSFATAAINEWVAEHITAEGEMSVDIDDVAWETLSVVTSLLWTPKSTITDRRVLGAVLLADDEGRPLDAMLWIVAHHHEFSDGSGSQWFPIFHPAKPSLSGWKDLWWGLCAIVSWGDWVSERPIVVHNRGKLKRLAKFGFDPSKIGPVRVLSSKHQSGRERTDPESTHASPHTHLRRGHWRNQRFGRGLSEQRQIWIPPVVVNPGHEGDWRETVFSLPHPSSIPDTPLPNMFRKIPATQISI